jgi:prepilin-type N-terminal cleavage/methylation domain-containing protein
MNAGFTLLETLVAFAILSLVTITGFGILGDSFRGLARIETHEDFHARAENLLNLMVQGLVPPGPDFEGLTIVETPLPRIGAAGWQPIRIQIAADGTLLLDSAILRRTVP